MFEDADLDRAVQGCIASKVLCGPCLLVLAYMPKFRNAGQTCVCTNRIFVHKSVHDEFIAKLSLAISDLKVGDGMDTASTVVRVRVGLLLMPQRDH